MDLKMKTYIFLFLALLVFSSCSLISPSESSQTSGPIQVSNTTWMLKQDDLSLQVSTDKMVYSPGETVRVHVDLENNGNSRILFTRPSPCSPDVLVTVDVSSSEKVELKEENCPAEECIQVPDNRGIIPEQVITRDVVWDQKIDTQPERIQVKPGKYIIKSSFKYSLNGIEKEMLLQNQIEIQGKTDLNVCREDALRIAYGNPDVISWYNSHLGKSIVFEEFGKYYIRNEYGTDRIDNSTAIKIIESEPSSQIYYEKDFWEVDFISEYGSEPKELIVRINARDCSIVEVKQRDSE